MQGNNNKKHGSLFVVSTPIGNLADITLRALTTLKEVAFIAAEDTRRTRKLLNAYDIKTHLISCNDYQMREKSAFIITEILNGNDAAYVSDAGTPGISDPGFTLINSAILANIRVIPIPGVSAAVTAISVSGLPMHHFTFYGFLPIKEGEKQLLLKKIAARERQYGFF